MHFAEGPGTRGSGHGTILVGNFRPERAGPALATVEACKLTVTVSEREVQKRGVGCCQTHDNCYKQAKKLDSCKVLVDNPYTNNYSYSCSNNEITCSSENNACEAFICNCDRNAAICFSKVPYNKEHKNLDKKNC
ncbi:TPA: Phospholipase A2-like [Bos taurus]|nr:TPA: Phospholipase A2-like [Bos taurus]